MCDVSEESIMGLGWHQIVISEEVRTRTRLGSDSIRNQKSKQRRFIFLLPRLVILTKCCKISIFNMNFTTISW